MPRQVPNYLGDQCVFMDKRLMTDLLPTVVGDDEDNPSSAFFSATLLLVVISVMHICIMLAMLCLPLLIMEEKLLVGFHLGH